MDKVIAIGDVHGKIGQYFDVLDKIEAIYGKEVKTIQLGDMGFIENYKTRAKEFEQSRFDRFDHLFFGGNHDEYPIPEWAGSLGDFGRVPFLDSSFFVRGAKSIDKESRTPGYDWWPEEELDLKAANAAIEKYIEVEPTYMFSHDAPRVASEGLFPNHRIFDSQTQTILQSMFEHHRPDVWIFGHWHETRRKAIGGTTFQCLGELNYMPISELQSNNYEK